MFSTRGVWSFRLVISFRLFVVQYLFEACVGGQYLFQACVGGLSMITRPTTILSHQHYPLSNQHYPLSHQNYPLSHQRLMSSISFHHYIAHYTFALYSHCLASSLLLRQTVETFPYRSSKRCSPALSIPPLLHRHRARRYDRYTHAYSSSRSSPTVSRCWVPSLRYSSG